MVLARNIPGQKLLSSSAWAGGHDMYFALHCFEGFMKLPHILYLIAVVSLLIFVQAVRLILLYNQVARYKTYWNHRASKSGQILYVALGDSAAQGIGASKPQHGYVGILVDRIARQTGTSVQVVNLSVSGAKINDVITSQLPKLKGLQPDVVTIEIGANDLAQYDAQRFTREFTKLTNLLPAQTYVANMPYFQTRPGRRQAASEASTIIATSLQSRSDLYLVDLQRVTTQRNSIFGYAADLFHPNDHTYRNWADAFWEDIRGKL